MQGYLKCYICYGESNFTIRGYVDSNYTDNLNKNKSTIGYVFTLAGWAVSLVLK